MAMLAWDQSGYYEMKDECMRRLMQVLGRSLGWSGGR